MEENENTSPVIEEEKNFSSEEISFEDLGLDEITLTAIQKKGFVHPSPIQVLAIPRLLGGEANVIARARTGTGKTAAFGLPLVQTLRNESDFVRAIILEPTRELAMQTCAEMASFTSGTWPRTAVVYGGASMGEQIRALKRGVEIVVGTPGRVQDLMERGVLDISKIDFFILDEGDELLDMGFVEDIEHIFESANPNCRVLLFSATVPKPILKIADKFMGDYEIVEEEGKSEEPLLIEQKYWIVRETEKTEALVRLIDISPDFYGLVFVQKKTDADTVSRALEERGYFSAALHGDIPQSQREKILSRFRAKRIRILVATDVAARGIDIGGLTHVVNYDLPFDGPTYVHRIGRTGRAGSSGMAVTFVRPEESRRKLNYLKAAIKRSAKGEMTEGNVPSVEEIIEAKKQRLFSEVKEKIGLESKGAQSASGVEKTENSLAQENAEVKNETENVAEQTSLKKGDPVFDKLAEELCKGQNPQEVVASLLAATYGRELNKNRYGKINSSGTGKFKTERKNRADGERRERRAILGENQIRLYVQMGWKDGYNPRRIANFFSKLLHIREKQVDAIDMADMFCLLSLPKEAGEKALALSAQDHSLPHIHVDSKSISDGTSYSKKEFSKGEKEKRRGEKSFSAKKFESVNQKERGERSERGAKTHARKNVHTPTQRTSRGSAALFKKSSEEY